MSRVLVTGATGFVGSRLVERLRDRGDEVIAAVRTANDHLDGLGVDQRLGGLSAADAALTEADALIHTAAVFSDDPVLSRTVNRDAAGHLARLAAAAGVPFVHVSTTSVYDLQAAGDVVDEDAPLRSADSAPAATTSSSTWYALSKAEGELEVERVVAATDLTATVLRPPAVLGAGPTSTWGATVPRRLRDGEWSPPHPETTFAWVHVEDLVAALLAAIDRPVTGTCNVIGGETTFGAYVGALHASVPNVPEPPPPAPDARRWTGRFDDTRLTELLGVRPTRTFDEAIEEIGRWWREHDGSPGGGGGSPSTDAVRTE